MLSLYLSVSVSGVLVFPEFDRVFCIMKKIHFDFLCCGRGKESLGKRGREMKWKYFGPVRAAGRFEQSTPPAPLAALK